MAKKLRLVEAVKAAAAGPTTLPAQPKDAKAKREAAKKAAAEAAAKASEGRPREYTVEDGDTLYKIAERFYGRSSAWVKIRDANKTIISVDGRVKAGDRIVLP
jgi:nucleoid-associated protein YgaU